MYVTNTLCIRPTRYEYAKNFKKKKNINSSAYASVLHTFSYVGIRWLTRQGVTGPLTTMNANQLATSSSVHCLIDRLSRGHMAS